MSVSNTKKLEAAHHRWQRKILKISWKDMITNKTVRERTGHDTLESIIRERRLTTQMVWSHVSDGFQQDSTTSDGLDPSALQKEERTSKSVMDFNSEKNSGFVGSDMG